MKKSKIEVLHMRQLVDPHIAVGYIYAVEMHVNKKPFILI